jgi:hypothetical protein
MILKITKTIYIFLFTLILSFISYSADEINLTEINKKSQEVKPVEDKSPLFIRSDVLEKNVLKVDLTLLQDMRKFTFDSIDGVGPPGDDSYSNNYMMNLEISFGFLDYFEAGIIFSFVFDHYDNKPKKPNQDEKYDEMFFNPEFFLKWKMVTSDKSGMNMTLFFSIQPSRNDEFLSGQIYQPYINSSTNSFRIGLYWDFPKNNVYPFLNSIFTLGVRFPGDVRSLTSSYETKNDEFIHSEDKYYWVIFTEAGVHYDVNNVFSIQFFIQFVYNSRFKNETNDYKLIFHPLYYIAPGLKINFKLSKIFSLSLKFIYRFYNKLEIDMEIPSLFIDRYITYKLSSNYTIYFNFYTRISF